MKVIFLVFAFSIVLLDVTDGFKIGGFANHPGRWHPGSISSSNKYKCGSLKKNGETTIDVEQGQVIVNCKEKSYYTTAQAHVKKERPTRNGDNLTLELESSYLELKFKERKYCYTDKHEGGAGHSES